MTVAKRIFTNIAALGLGLLVAWVGVAAGFMALQRIVTNTHEEFHELCDLHAVGAHVTQAERSLRNDQRDSAVSAVAKALGSLEQFNLFQQEEHSGFGPDHARDEAVVAGDVLRALREARDGLISPEKTDSDDSVFAALARAGDDLDVLTSRIERSVAEVHTMTAQRFKKTFWFIMAIEIVLLLVVAGISVLLYRSVVVPLRQLRDGTNRLAEGKLDTRLQAQGDREFVELEQAFNRMASELQVLCENLEKRIAEKSKELALAERLASVGFLAAGVAHEINNPLAIMSGYAESLLRSAKCEEFGGERPNWVRDLETIRDEAFRCKRITQSLLDLSRMGDEHREPVALGPVVENCTRLIAAWPVSRGVRFEIDPSSVNGAMVLASEPELKQVVLNLLVNAVEATTNTNGTVKLAVGRNNGWVEVVVRDNGSGMEHETLSRVFEPFFTSGKPKSGLGLGLTVSHAIARRHGGTLDASSPGPGLGSTLVLRLPALEEHRP